MAVFNILNFSRLTPLTWPSKTPCYMDKYEYEAFISYSREDSQWADKLFASLDNPYFRIFLDRERLIAGDKWNPQLNDAIQKSRCLIVLWSSKANPSQWVWEEIHCFKNEKRGEPIFVLLDLDRKVDAATQTITELKDADVYAAGANAVPPNLWDKLVNKTRDTIYNRKGSKPIKRVIFTLTQDRYAQIARDNKLPPSIIGKVSANNYTGRFADWRPFGKNASIETIMDNFLYADVNTQISDSGLSFHWEDMDWKEPTSVLWLPYMDNLGFIDVNVNATAAEIEKLKTGLCVVVVDTLALADLTIKDRFITSYDKCSENNDSLIMALHPYDISTELDFMRQQLRVAARRFYDNYFDPPMSADLKTADCFASTLDNVEIKRNLRFSLRKHVSRFANKEKSASTILTINQ